MDIEKIIPGHGPLSDRSNLGEMADYLKTFDAMAMELAAASMEPDQIAASLLEKLPPRTHGQWLVKASLMNKYIKK